MTSETSTTPNASGQPAGGTNPNGLKKLGETLDKLGGGLGDFAGALSKIPRTEGAVNTLRSIGGTLKQVGERVSAATAGAEEGFTSSGVVGGTLGFAEGILGPADSQKSDEDKTNLDKVREKISMLKKLWDDYYQNLFSKEGKLNTEVLKNMALQVGETILGSKKMSKIRKIIARAEVIRSGAEAIMTAVKSAPWPLNLPAIAFAAAIGKKQESAVSQAHDGIDKIPNTGTYMLEKGERVIGRRLNQDLTSFLGGINGEALPGSVDRSVTRSSTFNPTINLSIGGGVSDDAVLANRGAIETMIRQIYADYAQQTPFGV